MIKNNNIELTDLHRKYYRRYYSKRNSGTYSGYHINNESVIKILRDLETLGYIKFVYQKADKRKKYYSVEEVEDIYLYFESTGKRMPNKKLPTKPIIKIYDEDDIEINLILRNIKFEYSWDDSIIIDGKDCDVFKTRFDNYYIRFDDRMYKVVNDNEFNYSQDECFCTLPELKRNRAEKNKRVIS
jgi:hypothetical protein